MIVICRRQRFLSPFSTRTLFLRYFNPQVYEQRFLLGNKYDLHENSREVDLNRRSFMMNVAEIQVENFEANYAVSRAACNFLLR